MNYGRRRTTHSSGDTWPGFVDAMATLLMVFIFLLVIFVLAQFFLSQALSGRDEALDRLTQQVNELSDLLSLERQANADLRLNVAQLSASLQISTSARDELVLRLNELTRRAEDAEAAALTEKDMVKANLAELESLRRDIGALRLLRDTLERQVSDLSGSLEESELERGALRDRARGLEARLADEAERTLLAQNELTKREVRLAELQTLYLQTQAALENEEKLSSAAQNTVALLNTQLKALRAQLASIQEALEASEAKDKDSQVKIADLGRRLNKALAQKVHELQRYRSEFFGRLREVLANRPGITIVGDRFVFQSEVLFGVGSAELGEDGKVQLAAFTETLLLIAREIPRDINWILRIDGHTDRRPIHTQTFPSNWELSTARALSVTKQLIALGVPPHRLAPTGFGEFQPLDPRNDEIAYRRNRRIELKLTER